RDSGSQSHLRTTRTEGASIVQLSSSAPTKQNHKSSTSSIRQSNHATTTCPSCHKAHYDQCWREIGACLRCGQMGHYKRDCPCNHKGPSQTSKSMNGAPTNSVSYVTRDNYGPAGRGAGNKSTSDRRSGAVGRGQS
ncbi:hypothetical protein HAX54_018105, partial [Datura stramonium]|nr:hypothetical protein [Datura stramonium]